MVNFFKNRRVLFSSLLVLIVTFDQTTKSIFVTLCNRGVAFGFLGSFGFINSIVSFIILSVLIYVFVRQKDLFRFFALCLIIAGGISNLIDRIVFGCIRDFIQIWVFPSFNLADSAVTVGVLTLSFVILTNKRSLKV